MTATESTTIKALSLWQPYASLVATGPKRLETRSWCAPPALIGDRIAIHAAKKKPRDIWTSGVVPTLADVPELERYWQVDEHPDGPGMFRCRWVGPLGAVVATATLADCLPMVNRRIDAGHVLVEPDALWLAEPAEQEHHEAWAAETLQAAYRIDEERPFGDYRPGRFAWVLTDVQPLDEPVPARGRQRVWNWEPPT